MAYRDYWPVQVILDSDVLIDFLRGFPAAVDWLSVQDSNLKVSGIAAIEVVFGCADASGLRAARKLVQAFEVVWPLPIDMKTALDLASLHLSTGLDGPDAITAAIALRLGQEVGTFNVKHFRGVNGLTAIRPYER